MTHFTSTIDVGYLVIEVETTANNIGDPMIEVRESGHCLRLSREAAIILSDTLKAAANIK